MSALRIGIDARVLGGRFTGDRTYWSNLVRSLAAIDSVNEYRLYVREPLRDDSPDLPVAPNVAHVVVKASSDRLWSLAAFPAALRRDRVDVAHVQYTVPPRMPCPTVTTIHDISFRLFPNLFTFKDRLLLNLSLPGSIRRAAKIIAVSENTRRDLLAAFRNLPSDKVVVTHLAADASYRPIEASEQESARIMLNQTYGIGDRYALSVGVLQPRKNVPMLLRAFVSGCNEKGLPHKLVVTGKRGWLADDIAAAIAAAGDRVVFTDYVPDNHLPVLYGCADLFCYPSLYEGFGLPPLEAMACGCPVLASDRSSLPEVVGDAGLLLPPDREDLWREAIGDILTDAHGRQSMAAKGLERAALFSWEGTARATLGVYESMLPSGKGRK